MKSGTGTFPIRDADWIGGQHRWAVLIRWICESELWLGVRSGMSCRDAAKHFEVSVSSAIRWGATPAGL
jgi:hypothetical protein